MRLIFMGTPDFAVTCLAALIGAGHDIVAVYSQPSRPAGRGQALKPTPVHAFAESRDLPVHTPVSLKSQEEQQRFMALAPDAAVVVAYGLLLPQAILIAPKFGCFNVHASLLPRWRGAAPIQRAIMTGDTETGISIMRMEEGLDTGPVLSTTRITIDEDTTASTLHDHLMHVGATAIVKALEHPEAGGTAQSSDGITYAKKIDKSEARIDFTKPAADVLRHIHGLSPFPGAWFSVNGARVKVLRAKRDQASGAVATTLNDQMTIACGTGSIACLELQREGKGAMDVSTFLRGFPVPKGTSLA